MGGSAAGAASRVAIGVLEIRPRKGQGLVNTPGVPRGSNAALDLCRDSAIHDQARGWGVNRHATPACQGQSCYFCFRRLGF